MKRDSFDQASWNPSKLQTWIVYLSEIGPGRGNEAIDLMLCHFVHVFGITLTSMTTPVLILLEPQDNSSAKQRTCYAMICSSSGFNPIEHMRDEIQ